MPNAHLEDRLRTGETALRNFPYVHGGRIDGATQDKGVFDVAHHVDKLAGDALRLAQSRAADIKVEGVGEIVPALR